jgi:hypothetical protein
MTVGPFKRPLLTVLGVVAILVGVVWMGQGLNIIPGSVMTGDPKWLVIGAVLAVVGVLLVIFSLRPTGGRGRP